MFHVLALAADLHGNGGSAAGAGIAVIGLILFFAVVNSIKKKPPWR